MPTLNQKSIDRVRAAVEDFERRGKSAGVQEPPRLITPFRVRCLRVHTVENDYIICHTWDGTTEGTKAINVAKPFKLRHNASNYPGVSAVATVNANALTATISGNDESWVLPSELTYTDNDVIYAASVPFTGVTVSSNDLKLIDLNIDGRAWTK